MKAQAETIRTDGFTMDFFRSGHGAKAFVILPGLSVESVLNQGDGRVLRADASGEIAKLLKDHTDVELYMYDGYGHAAYDTAPDYKERILRFLAQE